jgi:branched-chain amino acid transport system ATP-binding protein
MLELKDLDAYCGKSHILQGVDMHIDAGEVVSMGEVPPRGTILFKGGNIAGLPCYHVPEHLPGPHGAAEPDVRHQGPKEAGQVAAGGRVQMFPNLAARADTAAGVISGGEKQMLTICRTLMGDPELVTIDDPTEGLAPIIVQQAGDLIAEIARRAVAILLVEQNCRSRCASGTGST